MKLLISDYDGTIKTYEKNPNFLERYIFKKNIEVINSFKNNNKFVIATGRNTSSILEEANKHNILYDYLISYNGRVILDKNNSIINAEYIDKNFIKELKDINLKNIVCFNEFEKTDNFDNLIYIYLKLKNKNEIDKLVKCWEEKYPDLKIDCNYIFNSIIIRKKYNKLKGIKKLLNNEFQNVILEDIITVGDETNDIEMLNYYNGYRMLISNPKLWFTTNNVTSSVHKLIKKIK